MNNYQQRTRGMNDWGEGCNLNILSHIKFCVVGERCYLSFTKVLYCPKFLRVTLIMLVLPFIVYSQPRFLVSGFLRDKNSGEALIGASVYVEELKTGVGANDFGYFNLNLPEGDFTFTISFIGYQSLKEMISIHGNIKRNFVLKPHVTALNEVKVVGRAREDVLKRDQIGSIQMNVKEAGLLPVIFGEQDILKSIQLMPGVSPVGEGSSGFYVRGGNADQNLILLDDAPVFNPSHLMGFFSVFNSDALRDVKLYKGGVPARYGGRASSVMDIRMNEGNMKDDSYSGGIGLIASRFMVEGPLADDRASFMISGRRTYADLFLPLSNDDMIKDNKLYFYDLNLKTNVILNDNNRIYLSGYLGRDLLKASDFGFNWGNKVASIRWNHIFSPSLFSNTTFIINDYNYTTEGDIDGKFSLKAGIGDLSVKQDYHLSINNRISFLFGFNSVIHKFKPGSVVSDSRNINSLEIEEKQGWETALYASAEHEISSRLKLGYGVRLSDFVRIGSGTENRYDEAQNLTMAKVYAQGTLYRNYFNVEPRFNLIWLTATNASIKLGYNIMSQYIHLLSNSSAGTPVDYWLPCSNNIKPQLVSQYSLGYFRQYPSSGINFSVEGFYKSMANQIDYRDNADVFLNQNAEAELLFGVGRAYGLELFCKKEAGIFSGWIAYTLSRTEKRFDGINQGSWFPARQDRTHDLSLVANVKASKKLTLSATWIYYTGNAITFPSGKYLMDGNIVNYYTSRNGYRMPSYHRLDLGSTFLLGQSSKFKSELSFSLYNAYGRKNAYVIQFRRKEGDSYDTEAVKIYLFSVIPSITWNFKF